MSPKYSIVIPTYNHLDDCLKPCIESILKNTSHDKIEIIIVANGCTDGTKNYLDTLTAAYGDVVVPIWSDEPLGYTKATNRGIQASRGEYVILLNNDCVILDFEPKDEWLNMLEKPFIEDPKMGVTGPSKLYDENVQEFFIIFFCAMIPKRLFFEFGLLDEIFNPGAGEDIDFCIKAQKAGYNIQQVPVDRNVWEYITAFPIYHAAETTVHDKACVPDWDTTFRRNTDIIIERHARQKIKQIDFMTFLNSFDVKMEEITKWSNDIDWFLNNNEKIVNMSATVKYDDRMVLTTLVNRFKPKVIIETGTNVGFSSTVMALAGDAEIHTYDIPFENDNPARLVDGTGWGYIFAGTYLEKRINKNNRNTFTLKATEMPVADMWFIDSDHSFPTIEHEYKLALENMKNGGVIIFHDSNPALQYRSDVFAYLCRNVPEAISVKTHCGVAYLIVPPPISGKQEQLEDAQPPAEPDPAPSTEPFFLDADMVGIMMTKNEADILPEILDRWSSLHIPIIALDDSDDGSFEILQSYWNVMAYKQSDFHDTNIQGSGDWMFQTLLELKRKHYGINNYVFVALGDEYWPLDPFKIVQKMQKEQATYARFHSLQFFMIKDIMDSWDSEKGEWRESMLNRQRLQYCSPGVLEDRIFYDDGLINYRKDQQFDTLPEGARAKELSINPFIYHYPVRNPIQAAARAKDRVERNYQPFYEHHYNKKQEELFLTCWPGCMTTWNLKDVEAAISEEFNKLRDDNILISIITPAYRPDAVIRQLNHFRAFKEKYADTIDLEWYVVFDGTKVSEDQVDQQLSSEHGVFVDFIEDKESLYGNAQRNHGLTKLAQYGYVYFLDDDNLIHENFFDEILKAINFHPCAAGFFFNQQRDDRGPFVHEISHDHIKSNGLVDTSQFIVKYDCINDLRWENFYQSDGKFIHDFYEQNDGNLIHINKPLCYWNKNAEEETMVEIISNKEDFEVTATISTKDRYDTTLPLAIQGILNQTVKPKHFILYDDGAQEDLRNKPLYAALLTRLGAAGIDWEVRFGKRLGQVANHQDALRSAKTGLIWRVDDDNMPEHDVLEKLISYFKSDSMVGAAGGLVLDPNAREIERFSDNKIEDIYLNYNAQWHFHKSLEPFEVDHLYSTFVYKVSAATHGYCMDLSPAGHREETTFSYGIRNNGYKLIVDPNAVTWHYREPSGGIRSYQQNEYWERDEEEFRQFLAKHNIHPINHKIIYLDNGIGDHIAFRIALKNSALEDKPLIIGACYPSVFENMDNIKTISLDTAQYVFGPNACDQSVYKYMAERDWKKSMVDAYKEMYEL